MGLISRLVNGEPLGLISEQSQIFHYIESSVYRKSAKQTTLFWERNTNGNVTYRFNDDHPDGYVGVLATLDDLDGVVTWVNSNRSQGVETITLDGVNSLYYVPHGLGVTPSFASGRSDAGRGNSLNFDVFNTTWDNVNITITYQNPPTPGSLDINWIALK